MKRALVAAFALIPALSFSSFAALGGDVSSVDTDQVQMRAQRRITQKANYSIHELQADSARVVREFVSQDGKVFAVAWQGQGRPDMQQLLGSYYDEYVKALPSQRLHHPVTIQTSNMIIQSGGHQHAQVGRIYVPGMVPQGVAMEEIK